PVYRLGGRPFPPSLAQKADRRGPAARSSLGCPAVLGAGASGARACRRGLYGPIGRAGAVASTLAPFPFGVYAEQRRGASKRVLCAGCSGRRRLKGARPAEGSDRLCPMGLRSTLHRPGLLLAQPLLRAGRRRDPFYVE